MPARLARLFAAILFLAGVALPAHAETWRRATAPGFVVYSQGEPAELREDIANLRRYDAVLHSEFSIPPGPQGAPLTIYLLERPGDVAKMLGRKGVAGYYAPRLEGSFIVAHREPPEKEGALGWRETLFHEYAHHFMYRHVPAPWPSWYREGVADYLSTVTFLDDGRWVVGRPALYRLGTAIKEPVPLLRLLENDDNALPEGRERWFYANAWLLVHLFRSDPYLERRLEGYLDALARGASEQVALLELGNIADLQRRMSDHARTAFADRISSERLPAPAPAEVETLGPAASRLVGLRLRWATGVDRDSVLADLTRLAADYPDDAQVAYQLAVALSQAMSDRAEPQADRVLTLAPDMPRALVMKGELARRRDAPEAEVNAWLSKAARLAPDDPLVQLAWFQARAKAGKAETRIAFADIEHIYRMATEIPKVRLTYALALATIGRVDEAEAVLVRLAAEPEGGGRAKAALARFRKIRALKERTRGAANE
ncbi:hypothetical protein B2G71_07845 [Novosphingobium sp. PC22D]|uniref:tetratricopeptide repeat protein n=1 Tax=Novosphingobium sp. PC22D TaxID=1962403 RepID=UPI000BEF24D7|nr:hypothetical protein [Novosphingobium sp. PC22D]PEQ13337.1 hypothetical protein B2G71_07845 [Novosphingobium sp. PC22D]